MLKLVFDKTRIGGANRHYTLDMLCTVEKKEYANECK